MSTESPDNRAEPEAPQELPERATEAEVTPDPLAEAEARAAAAEAKAAETHDRYLRAQAELENVRKRAQRELAEGLRYANEQLVRDLLPALDNLERGLAAAQGEDPAVSAIREGVALTQSQILGILKKYGVIPVEALGRPFDPTVHEAVQRVPSSEPEGTVVAEYRRGYTLNGRLVRPAMVAVAMPASTPGPDEEGGGGGESA
ncbi:MAG TPA: nucleotide exchange factor GrpE [Thermodesulfobacteriota bacterium]